MELAELERDSFYSTENGILLQGDCLEWMSKIPDHSIDMILCDLPYGTTACKWDSIIPFDKLWEQYKRITNSNGTIILTAVQPFTSALIASNFEMFKYCWVWKKSKGSNFLHVKNMPLKITEDVVVFSKRTIGHIQQLGENRMIYNPQGVEKSDVFVKQNPNKSELKYHRESQSNHKDGYQCQGKNYPTTLLEFKSESNTIHPTQKPVALFEYLINTYSNEGETILDNTAGVCTTAVAAENTNRKWICIEKELEYCEKSKERIEKHLLSVTS
jgi:site-specific DNA-methyltransferase (adenine-specific)